MTTNPCLSSPPSRAPERARARRGLSLLSLAPLLAPVLLAAGAAPASAFCGFYVGKADADLWNDASQVVIVRDGDRTVLTMSNDYKGELAEFALVVPVPVVLEKGQIHVGERAIVERLDAFSAPRLVEYHDDDPCRSYVYELGSMKDAKRAAESPASGQRAKSLGVTIEAQYTVGEYDILILSAKESAGLETWLRENGYRLPRGASRALQPYIRQGLKFFVAKVNLEEQAKTGFQYLRPLQMAYESPRFMLPIRLGMLNARGPQDLLIYVLTRRGRVETTNYRTVKVPSNVELPPYVEGEFADFYKAMFEKGWEREGRNVVFLEYFWDMGWCDPCAADPLSVEELRKAGVFWLEGAQGPPGILPPGPVPRRGSREVKITRLHVRYDEEHFPEDLFFKETEDRQNFQGRYVLRHPWKGEAECDAAKAYFEQLHERQEKEAQTLASLTGWDIQEIRRKAGLDSDGSGPKARPWWEWIFGD